MKKAEGVDGVKTAKSAYRMAVRARRRHRLASPRIRLCRCAPTDGALRIADAAGKSVIELKQGVAYFRKAGVEHNVTNAGDRYLAFVDIELVEHPG